MSKTYHSLSTSDFNQTWTTSTLITVSDDWSNVPSLMGYRGDGLANTGADPQTVLLDGSSTPVQVFANQSSPNTLTTGGVAEFAGTVALAGDSTAVAPHLVLHLDTTGRQNVQVSYLLSDLETSADNAIQSIALQYRLGETGDFINLPAGAIPDATDAGGTRVRDARFTVQLPPSAQNQGQVQVRWLTVD
jgi:hypothetical protein